MELDIKTKQAKETVNALEIGVANMEQLSTDSNVKPSWTNPNDVTFMVSYAKEWKGDKPMPEGPVVVSQETAEHFLSLKIGKIQK